MTLEGKQIGFALTGSHCTYEEIWPEVEKLVQLGADVYPIVSPSVAHTDTRFGKAADIVARFEGLTGKKVISTIVEAEPLGPKKLFHCMIIAPYRQYYGEACQRHH